MPELQAIITGLGSQPFLSGSTLLTATEHDLTIRYETAMQTCRVARENLDDTGNAFTKTQSLILKEKIGIDDLTYHYATIHPKTIRDSVVDLRVENKGLTSEFLAYMRTNAIDRVTVALASRATVTSPKLSDILAYSTDVVFSTAVFIQDKYGRVLLQQRSKNETSFPLCWQPSANGKLENYVQALEREVGEELGQKVQALNLPVTLVGETPYLLSKKGVEKPAIGRDYSVNIGDLDIMPLIKISPETEKFEFITQADVMSGKVISQTRAKQLNVSPQTHIIMFDDQYASLLRIMKLPEAKVQ